MNGLGPWAKRTDEVNRGMSFADMPIGRKQGEVRPVLIGATHENRVFEEILDKPGGQKRRTGDGADLRVGRRGGFGAGPVERADCDGAI